MANVNKVMPKTETISWEGKPHIIKFLRFCLIYLFIANMVVGLFFAGLFIFYPIPAIVITTVLEIVIIVYCYYLWKTVKYSFDGEGIKHSQGIIYKVRKFVPIYKITNYSNTQGLIQQWLNVSSVAIHTAGMGTNMPEIILGDLKQDDAEKVMSMLKKNIIKVYKDKYGE